MNLGEVGGLTLPPSYLVSQTLNILGLITTTTTATATTTITTNSSTNSISTAKLEKLEC